LRTLLPPSGTGTGTGTGTGERRAGVQGHALERATDEDVLERLAARGDRVDLAARLLRSASDALDHVAERVSTPERAMDIGAGVVEFHALYREGAAPEGALYVNGRLVAILPEVPRL
jgi:hypothetical protein